MLLGASALVCSRAMFAFFNDPEGPNLLIVTVMAAVVYAVSLAAYVPNFSNTKKFLLAILIQILFVTGLYLLLN